MFWRKLMWSQSNNLYPRFFPRNTFFLLRPRSFFSKRTTVAGCRTHLCLSSTMSLQLHQNEVESQVEEGGNVQATTELELPVAVQPLSDVGDVGTEAIATDEDPVNERRHLGGIMMYCLPIFLIAAAIAAILSIVVIQSKQPSVDEENYFRVEPLPFKVVSVMTDSRHACAVLADSGRVQCWGAQIGVPSNLETDPSIILALGDGFTCALYPPSGKIQCWGDNRAADYVQPPKDLGPVQFVTASGGTVCTISQRGGQGRCWGFVREGRVELTIPVSEPLLSVSTSKRGELERVCGIVNNTYRLECWKSNMDLFTLEELPLMGNGVSANAITNNLQSMAVMDDYVCVVHRDASSSCWSFVDDTSPPTDIPVIPPTIKYRDIIAGTENSFCMIDMDGKVLCLGTSSTSAIPPPASVGPLGDLSIGSTFMCGILENSLDGVCWGVNQGRGWLSPLGQEPQYSKKVAVGGQRTCSIDWSDPVVSCWGMERFQLTGVPVDLSVGDEVLCGVYQIDDSDTAVICAVGQNGGIRFRGQVNRVIVSRHDDTVCTLTRNAVSCFQIVCVENGLCWQDLNFVGNPDSQLGMVTDLELSLNHYCAIDMEGIIQCSVFDTSGQNTIYAPAMVPDEVGMVLDMALGRFFTCVVHMNFTVQCWGDETQYGVNYVLDDIPQGGYYQAIAATDNEVCAITLDNFVHCWGRPFSNALYIPDGVISVKELIAGSSHFCTHLEDMQIICWGSNQFGELSPRFYG